MSEPRQETVIIGEPTWNLAVPAKGSKVYSCTMCGTDTWLSKPGQRMLAESARLICRPCALKEAFDGDKICLVPGALAELSRHFGRNVTEQEVRGYIEHMRRAD